MNKRLTVVKRSAIAASISVLLLSHVPIGSAATELTTVSATTNSAASLPAQTPNGEQVLVYVRNTPITAGSLRSALLSSPSGQRFASMDADVQGKVRGDMLNRLVAAELFRQEAIDIGIAKSQAYKDELSAYRVGVLNQLYINKLRASISLSADKKVEIKKRFAGDSDAQAAAESLFYAYRFPLLKREVLDSAVKQFNVKTYPDGLYKPHPLDQMIVAEGDGFTLRYRDLLTAGDASVKPTADRLDSAVETIILAKLAEAEGMDVEAELQSFSDHLLARMLIESKEADWLGDAKKQENYFDEHEGLGYIPGRWEIAQIVIKTEDEAEKLKARIDAGESFFELATQYSIDPYGRQHAGEMGWVQEGKGLPVLENMAKSLPDNVVSDPIKTARGYHLINVLARRLPQQKFFETVRDRVKQAMIQENMATYFIGLQKKHPLHWVK